MGFREIVLALIALLVAYLAYVLLRLWRLKRRASVPQPQPEYQTLLDISPLPVAPPTQRAEPSLVPEPSGSAAHEPFDAMMAVARMRFQIEALEARQQSTNAELEDLREQLDALRNARNVAPQYGEAVTLAQRGLSSDAIAERCGISVSEAELVAALARGIRTQE